MPREHTASTELSSQEQLTGNSWVMEESSATEPRPSCRHPSLYSTDITIELRWILQHQLRGRSAVQRDSRGQLPLFVPVLLHAPPRPASDSYRT